MGCVCAAQLVWLKRPSGLLVGWWDGSVLPVSSYPEFGLTVTREEPVFIQPSSSTVQSNRSNVGVGKEAESLQPSSSTAQATGLVWGTNVKYIIFIVIKP